MGGTLTSRRPGLTPDKYSQLAGGNVGVMRQGRPGTLLSPEGAISLPAQAQVSRDHIVARTHAQADR